PIVSTTMWFDRPVLRGDFLGLLGTTTQWAFNRTRLLGEQGPGQCVSAVISAGRDVVEWDSARVTATVLADLRSVVPAAVSARLQRSRGRQGEHAPAAERLRPSAVTPLRGFVLAGDWTATGLPPTIESAVESGERAASLLVEEIAA